MALEDAAECLRGALGTQATLTVQRRGRMFNLRLRREVINGLKPSAHDELRVVSNLRVNRRRSMRLDVYKDVGDAVF